MRKILTVIICLLPFFAFSQKNTSAIPDSMKTEQDELTELQQRYQKYYAQKKNQARTKAEKKEAYVWKKGKTTQDFDSSKKVTTTAERPVSYAQKPKKHLTKKGGASKKENNAWKKKLRKGL